MKTQALTIEYHGDDEHIIRPALATRPRGWNHANSALTIHVVNVPDNVIPVTVVRLYGETVDVSVYGVPDDERTWSVEYDDLGRGRIIRKQAVVA